ncbi:MAG: acyltransferase [Cetobacterium sp.]
MKKVIIQIYKIYKLSQKVSNKLIISFIKKKCLKNCGNNVYLGKNFQGNYSNISLGNNVSIGPDAFLLSSKAEIIIGNNVMFGPKVSLVTGNHRIDILGKYMIDITDEEKLKTNDQNIIIEDDVWIGMGAIILKGVTVGEGSVVGAGSVITKNIPPYSIIGGNPAKIIKKRFTEDQKSEHITKLSEVR